MSDDSEIKVTQLPEFDEVEWEVKDFSKLRHKKKSLKWSPKFEASGFNFQILFKIAVASPENQADYVSLQLTKYKGGPIPSYITFSMKVGDIWIATKKCKEYEQNEFYLHYLIYPFVKISEMEKSLKYNTPINSNSAKPAITAANQDSFTIVCTISYVDRFEQCDVSTQTANSNDNISDVKKLNVIKFSDDETVKESKKSKNDHGVQTLSSNLKELYLKKEHCDVKIKIGSKEFSGHKFILSARSPVFSSMFRHEMAENVNGTLDISDCEPESFEVFLEFLYTGKMDGVCYSNAIGLYKMADKYTVDDLKEECVSCLCEDMDIEYICDILEFAAVHEEAKLLETAINFFIENVKDILVTAKWQNFMIENTTLANECLKKMVEKKVS